MTYCGDDNFMTPHIWNPNIFVSFLSFKETKSDRRSRPGPELLFDIPDFLRSLICCKSKDSWSLAKDSSPQHPSYKENNAAVRYVILM